MSKNEVKSKSDESTRRDFMVLTASSMAAVGGVCSMIPMVSSLNPAEDTLAASSIEVDLSGVNPGQTITVKWRGKPVVIRHRTETEIAEAKSVPMSELKDPEPDSNRVQKGHEQWLVMIGICTHLGCVPIGGQGEYDGWFCPCHGSHYDSAGRIRKGPAPLNLELPPYSFISDTKIKIG
ncbi:MAG: ubiquinol-cytochrome c reductase, iron-sulfur subunit [Pseudomonadota bacterium]|jgi:ubiquinol-cytochrome c reductase iron-sulfur subunit